MRAGVFFRWVYRAMFRSRHGARSRLWGSVLAVALSLIPLVVVLEMADGMIEGITSRYLETSSYHLQVNFGRERSPEEIGQIEAAIAGVAGIKSIARERSGLGLAYSSTGGRSGANIRAIDERLWKSDPVFRQYLRVTEGNLDLGDSTGALVGTEMARRLKLSTGDTLKILTTRSFGSWGLIPKVSIFTVRGIFSTGYQEMDKLWILVPEPRGSQILSTGASRQFLGIKLDKVFEDAQRIADQLRPLVPADVTIHTWYEIEQGQYLSFRTTKALLGLIMILILGVAAITISSNLVMMQIERRDEIAMARSIGMSPGGITAVFLASGMIVGFAGTLLGLVAGIVVTININSIIASLEWFLNIFASLIHSLTAPSSSYKALRILDPRFYLDSIPVSPDLSQLLQTGVLALVFSFFASLLPAWRAGRLRPLEVLRRH